MDPDKTLEIIRQARGILFMEGEPYDPETVLSLAEAVDDLDTWLTKGGFLPAAWGQSHVVHVTAEPVAEDVVWCEACQEWVTSGAPEGSW